MGIGVLAVLCIIFVAINYWCCNKNHRHHTAAAVFQHQIPQANTGYNRTPGLPQPAGPAPPPSPQPPGFRLPQESGIYINPMMAGNAAYHSQLFPPTHFQSHFPPTEPPPPYVSVLNQQKY